MSSGTDTEAKKQGGLWEILVIVVQAFLLAIVVRVFLYQPFNIPSGSMIPTLLVGDYLFVSKLSYGYSKYSFFGFTPGFNGRIWGAEPKRGDVAVFKLPRDNSTDYIKRVIGLPGDKIQVVQGVLHINGEPVQLRRVDDFPLQDGTEVPRMVTRYEETLPNGVKHMVLRDNGTESTFQNNTRIYQVPEGHYFMMGDNRDHSQDSRFLSEVGYVPRDNLIGRADIIFFSFGENAHWYSPISWFTEIRWPREFTLIR